MTFCKPLLNMFYAAKLKASATETVSDDGKHVVILPTGHVSEDDMERYAEVQQFPIIPGICADRKKTCNAKP